jgi:hypothetical protein
MKTRQEMVYDFMVALASNPSTENLIPSDIYQDDMSEYEGHEVVFIIANRLADEYLRSLA